MKYDTGMQMVNEKVNGKMKKGIANLPKRTLPLIFTKLGSRARVEHMI